MIKNCKKFTKLNAVFAKKFKFTEFFMKNAEFLCEFLKKFTAYKATLCKAMQIFTKNSQKG